MESDEKQEPNVTLVSNALLLLNYRNLLGKNFQSRSKRTGNSGSKVVLDRYPPQKARRLKAAVSNCIPRLAD